jgi:hypothetical protein
VTNAISTSPAERRARLLSGKLAAIVRRALPGVQPQPGTFPPGAAALADARAWVLLDTEVDDGTGLGAAIIWALRNGASELDVVADLPLAVAARRAAAFRVPIRVWSFDGDELSAVAPSPVQAAAPASAAHLAFAEDIEAAGASVVVEHGVVIGEVRGLEVCRVVDVETVDGPIVRLEVGVGPQDRHAFALIHGDVPTREALAGVVAAVAAARHEDAPGHPLSRLAPERRLRWRLEQEPWLVGMAAVRPAEPPVPRRGLRLRSPCTAVGEHIDGSPAIIVCSVGVDLDVIPYAADARLVAEAEAGVGRGGGGSPVETLVVVPERDLLRVTTELADQLRHSVSVLGVTG